MLVSGTAILWRYVSAPEKAAAERAGQKKAFGWRGFPERAHSSILRSAARPLREKARKNRIHAFAFRTHNRGLGTRRAFYDQFLDTSCFQHEMECACFSYNNNCDDCSNGLKTILICFDKASKSKRVAAVVTFLYSLLTAALFLQNRNYTTWRKETTDLIGNSSL